MLMTLASLASLYSWCELKHTNTAMMRMTYEATTAKSQKPEPDLRGLPKRRGAPPTLSEPTALHKFTLPATLVFAKTPLVKVETL